MSKDQNKTININVEIVDNLIYSLEWIISTLNFWHIENNYPTNMICKVCADFLYEFRKMRTEQLQKKSKK